MHAQFEKYLKDYAGMPDEEIKMVCGLAISHSLRRNEMLLQAGEVCRHKIFIVSGLLRTYLTTPNGSEHILQFSPEGTWTLDVESYDKGTPSAVNIETVEPTDVLLWKKDDFQCMLAEIPTLKKLSERLISGNIYYNRRRMATTLSATPEEKYDDFVLTFPGLMSRLPLRMIASYLGISVKTLTRIRYAQLHREEK